MGGLFPKFKSTFCCQLKVPYGLALCNLLFILYFNFKVINLFSTRCDYHSRLGNNATTNSFDNKVEHFDSTTHQPWVPVPTVTDYVEVDTVENKGEPPSTTHQPWVPVPTDYIEVDTEENEGAPPIKQPDTNLQFDHNYHENDKYYFYLQNCYQISLPYIRCCDKRFNNVFWSINYIIMFALALFLFLAFGYLNDTVLKIAMLLFGLASIGDMMMRIASILAPILSRNYWYRARWNPLDCYIEDLMLFGSYIYMMMVMDSFRRMMDDGELD